MIWFAVSTTRPVAPDKSTSPTTKLRPQGSPSPVHRWTTSQVDGLARLEATDKVLLVAANYEEPIKAEGTMRIDGPQQEQWVINGEFAAHWSGPPGTYDLHVNYESEGSPDRLIGVLGSFASLS
jgi:hypothetical protein